MAFWEISRQKNLGIKVPKASTVTRLPYQGSVTRHLLLLSSTLELLV